MNERREIRRVVVEGRILMFVRFHDTLGVVLRWCDKTLDLIAVQNSRYGFPTIPPVSKSSSSSLLAEIRFVIQRASQFLHKSISSIKLIPSISIHQLSSVSPYQSRSCRVFEDFKYSYPSIQVQLQIHKQPYTSRVPFRRTDQRFEVYTSNKRVKTRDASFHFLRK